MRSIRQMLNIRSSLDNKRALLCSAIRQLRKLEFYYHGGYRTVEPFVLGIVLKGDADNESLLCYQTAGFSDLREAVGWKLYRASEMEDIEVLREKFTGDRPGYDLDHIDMAKLICWVTFSRKTVEESRAPGVTTGDLTHNELMARFRNAHPSPIPSLSTTLWPEPLVAPYPELAESKI